MNKNLVSVVVIVAVAAASFWGGTFYQSRQFFGARRPAMMGGAGQFQGMGRPGGGGSVGGRDNGSGGGGASGERLISGRLDKVGDEQLTLTTRFGSVKVTIDKSTKVKSAQKADVGSLKVGNQVMIESIVGQDGEVKAKLLVGE